MNLYQLRRILHNATETHRILYFNKIRHYSTRIGANEIVILEEYAAKTQTSISVSSLVETGGGDLLGKHTHEFIDAESRGNARNLIHMQVGNF